MVLPEAFERACADPPRVHPRSLQGVYRTQDSCYRFISERTPRPARTLETGLGLSTVLFAMLGSRHTAVFLDPAEGDVLRDWGSAHDLDLGQIELISGGSVAALPSLPPDPLDLLFIDGGHGYPIPQLDWLFAGSRLRRDGILVVDDLQLWAPRQLATFLDADPRWERLASTAKWAGYRRLSEGSLSEDWTTQPFPAAPQRKKGLLRRARKRLSRLSH